MFRRESSPLICVFYLGIVLVMAGCSPLYVAHICQNCESTPLVDYLDITADSYFERYRRRVYIERIPMPDGIIPIWDRYDLIIGDQTVGWRLKSGVSSLNAYCDIDGCNECRSETPPAWCHYASGNFSRARVDELAISKTAICDQNSCPECFLANPPPHCEMMSRLRATNPEIDVIQGSLSRVEANQVQMYGVPLRWRIINAPQSPQLNIVVEAVYLNNGSDNKKAALKLLTALTSDDGQHSLYELGNRTYFPASRSAVLLTRADTTLSGCFMHSVLVEYQGQGTLPCVACGVRPGSGVVGSNVRK